MLLATFVDVMVSYCTEYSRSKFKPSGLDMLIYCNLIGFIEISWILMLENTWQRSLVAF